MFVVLIAAVAIAAPAFTTPAAPPPHRAGADSAAPGQIDSTAPRDIGSADSRYWGPLNDQGQTASVATLKAAGRGAADLVKRPMRLQESRLFLLYTDLPEIETARYALLLDRMYTHMADLLGVEKGRNIYRGKALIFVFSRIEDYRLYERLCENNDPGGSVAMTSCFGDGMVHIAFYRYPDDLLFAHLLVHESVHGFLHRYRSPAHVPSWANEGLADAVAAELVNDPQRSLEIVRLTHTGLAAHDHAAGNFFVATHLDGWQYPLAEWLCAYMLHQNRQGYLDFIKGIKDGLAWEESLKTNYKMSPRELLDNFGKAAGLKSLHL